MKFVVDIRWLGGEEKNSRLKELANLCGINEVMHKSIHDLSKGYKQRVGLAHAMMSDPEILVLDEPTSGLDPNQIVEIRDIIREIGKKKTIILSTHILSEAEVTCDRIVIINKGKIAADGSTEELKNKTANECIINISFQKTDFAIIKNIFQGVSGVNGVTLVNDRNKSTDFYLSCENNKDIRPRIYSLIKTNDWILLDFHTQTRALEAIFRELTKGDRRKMV